MRRSKIGLIVSACLATLVCLTSAGVLAGSTSPSIGVPLAVRVSGKKLVDAGGSALQIRGVAYGKSAFAYINGMSETDVFAGHPPLIEASASWKANSWRISLNEASWLGLKCVDTAGVSHVADPGPAHGAPSYQQQILNEVNKITLARMYTILVLHWAAPDNHCPMTQTQMADADHSLDFWRSVAKTFENNPAVMFELYNEPYDAWMSPGQDAAKVIAKGGAYSGYPAQPGYKLVNRPWKVASMQDMITVIRAVGAANIVLVGTNAWDDDLSEWLDNVPTDPIGQMAATRHPYPPQKQIHRAVIVSGGSGYVINDTIGLARPNPGTGVYSPAVFKVAAVRNGAVTEVQIVNPGRYLATKLPGPSTQGSTSGQGTGASFAVNFAWAASGYGMQENWPIALKIAARYPIIFTEIGDHDEPGTVGAHGARNCSLGRTEMGLATLDGGLKSPASGTMF